MQVELVVGLFGVDGGTLAEVAAEAVDDGVLGFQSGVVAVGEDFAAGGGVDHEGAVDVENLLPANLVHLVVELLLVVGVKLGEGFQDGQCRTAAIVGAVEQTHIAFKLNGSCDGRDVEGA